MMCIWNIRRWSILISIRMSNEWRICFGDNGQMESSNFATIDNESQAQIQDALQTCESIGYFALKSYSVWGHPIRTKSLLKGKNQWNATHLPKRIECGRSAGNYTKPFLHYFFLRLQGPHPPDHSLVPLEGVFFNYEGESSRILPPFSFCEWHKTGSLLKDEW